MIHAQGASFECLRLSSATTNATAHVTVDRQDADYVTVLALQTAAAATNTSAKWTVLKLTHGTTTDFSNHTTISGGVGTTNATTAAGEFAIPAYNVTTEGGIVRFGVDCRNKERYIGIQNQPPTDVNPSGFLVMLSRKREMPDTAALKGVIANVEV